MSRVYLFIAVIIALTGVAASFFAPTENMGMQESFYAHLLLVAPPLFIAVVVSALGIIIQRLDLLLGKGTRIEDQPALSEDRMEDFGSLFAETLRTNPVDQAPAPEPELPLNFEEPGAAYPTAATQAALAIEDLAVEEEEDQRRAPTVDEFLQNANENDSQPSARLAREGMFAGRHYRMYEDGSMEIDTDQSTIKFDSLEEFRSFVSSASKD